LNGEELRIAGTDANDVHLADRYHRPF
jgi:hypothetical protein